MLRKLLTALAVLLLAAGTADAQQSAQKGTYRYAGVNVTSFAASPTDWLVISGSNTKLTKVTRLSICGTATSASTIDVLLIKRSAADTAGTQSSITGVPMDVSRGASAGTVLAYTANPTLGATVLGGSLDGKKLNLSTVGAAGCLFWDFGTAYAEPVVLRGAIQQLAVNLNGVTVPAGTSLSYTVETTEEP